MHDTITHDSRLKPNKFLIFITARRLFLGIPYFSFCIFIFLHSSPFLFKKQMPHTLPEENELCLPDQTLPSVEEKIAVYASLENEDAGKSKSSIKRKRARPEEESTTNDQDDVCTTLEENEEVVKQTQVAPPPKRRKKKSSSSLPDNRELEYDDNGNQNEESEEPPLTLEEAKALTGRNELVKKLTAMFKKECMELFNLPSKQLTRAKKLLQSKALEYENEEELYANGETQLPPPCPCPELDMNICNLDDECLGVVSVLQAYTQEKIDEKQLHEISMRFLDSSVARKVSGNSSKAIQSFVEFTANATPRVKRIKFKGTFDKDVDLKPDFYDALESILVRRPAE